MQVAVDDLTHLDSDAIVRPATTRLDSPQRSARRVEEAGGEEFRARLRVNAELEVGAAVVTGGGGDLRAEFVIHAIIQSDAEPVSRSGVARAWLSVLQQAERWGFARVAAPPLGVGAGNLSIEDAADIMISGLQAHRGTASLPTDVSVVVDSAADRDAFAAALAARGSTA
ncbi:MAG: macro domain-containing protein [Gemmatimonadales bacterium]